MKSSNKTQQTSICWYKYNEKRGMYIKTKELCKNIKHMCGRRQNKKKIIYINKVCIYASTRLH